MYLHQDTVNTARRLSASDAQMFCHMLSVAEFLEEFEDLFPVFREDDGLIRI